MITAGKVDGNGGSHGLPGAGSRSVTQEPMMGKITWWLSHPTKKSETYGKGVQDHYPRRSGTFKTMFQSSFWFFFCSEYLNLSPFFLLDFIQLSDPMCLLFVTYGTNWEEVPSTVSNHLTQHQLRTHGLSQWWPLFPGVAKQKFHGAFSFLSLVMQNRWLVGG